MENQKILIVAYYWPPSAGVGVQRWLKMSRHLVSQGYEVFVFTPENPAFNLKDESLLQEVDPAIEVIRFPIREPFHLFDKLTGGKQKGHVKQGLALEKQEKSFFDKAMVWVRGNLFIPDPRVFWVRPSVKFLKDIIEQHQIQTVITTGPPHSMHLIGKGLKKKTDISWLADFRDPWSEWDILDKLKVSKAARKLHRYLERTVLKAADAVIVTSQLTAEAFKRLGARKTKVIYNGVEEKDLKNLPETPHPLDKFRISHIGLLNEIRNPVELWQALRELLQEHPQMQEELELNLAGIIGESILESLKNDPLLSKVLKYQDYLPHQEVFKQCSNSALLLLILNRSDKSRCILPSKLYEYLSVGRPVLLLGPEKGDAEIILNEMQAGDSLFYGDKEGIKQAVYKYYLAYKQGDSLYQQKNVSRFTRKNQAKELVRFLEEL